MSVLTCAGLVYADQFNDLYYIDPGGVPDLSEEGRQNENGLGSGNGNTNGGGVAGGGSGGGAPSQGGGGNSSVGGSGSGAGTSGAGTQGLGAGEQDEEEEESEALESLLDEGAISGGLAGVDGGVFGSSGTGAIVVNGSKIRSFLRKDPDIDEVLRYWKIGKGKNRPDGKTSKDRLTPGEYYALVAATIAADDEQFEEARFTARDFEVTYRSRGALFALIPWQFPIRVSVTPLSPRDRVQVRFPWYHWFVREYFTRTELTQEIENVILSVTKDAEVGADMNAEIFDAVTQLLREKVRTITESILLR